MRIPKNLPASTDRPSWTQCDLHAYQHLHTYRNGEYRIIQNHFVSTKGFSTIQDLKYFENGGYGNGN